MAQNRYYSSAALPTTLAAAITSSLATSISVNSVTGNPGSFPYTLLIDWGLPIQEAVSVTAVSGTGPYTLTVTRGIDGTTAQTHSNGATVVHGVTEQDYNEPQVHIAASSGVHGVTGSVVGTTDIQTLTNKTLGATTFSGAGTMSISSATGGLVNVTNTHASPSNPNVNWTAAGNTDNVLGVSVSGDTVQRYLVNSAGKISWGAGGASATDTDLYRNSAGELKTDNSITAGANLSIGGAALAAGGTGVLGINNATVDPSSTPSGGTVLHSKSGHLKIKAGDGLDYQHGPYIAYLTSPFTNTTTASYVTITGLTAAISTGNTYMFRVWALFSQAATTGTVSFAVNGPTTSTLAYSVEQLLGTTLTEANSTAYNTGPTSGTLTASTNYLVKITGLLVATASGTLAATVNQSAAGSLSVLAGSFLEVHAVA